MICSCCGNDYPLTLEYFAKSQKDKNKFKTRCKLCDKKYLKEYYIKHKARIKEKSKRYYEENKEHIAFRGKLYHYHNREKILGRKREYYKNNVIKISFKNSVYRNAHKREVSAYGKEYRKANRIKLLEYTKKYFLENRSSINNLRRVDRVKNPEKYSSYERNRDRAKRAKTSNRYQRSEKGILAKRLANAKRRSLKKNVISVFSKSEWLNCLEYFENKCVYCGSEKSVLSKDHFIPLSKGGEYTVNNIVCSCLKCNSSKQNLNFFEWYPKQPFYSKGREEKILKYLNYDKAKHFQQLFLLGGHCVCRAIKSGT